MYVRQRKSRHRFSLGNSIYFSVLFSFISIIVYSKIHSSFHAGDRISLQARLISNGLENYNNELRYYEQALFRPYFHNNFLKLKLNLTTMAKEFNYYLTMHPVNGTSSIQINCLVRDNNSNSFVSICTIYFTFDKYILNSEGIKLNVPSFKSNCTITLKNTADIIIISLHKMFSSQNEFRFTSQLTNLNQLLTLSWPLWPPTENCINLMPFNVMGHAFRCPAQTILRHRTSNELFFEERRSMSNWLNLQYENFNRINANPSDKRRLLPFELEFYSRVCPKEFREWITQYQQYHETTFIFLNNQSIKLEEKFDRIQKENWRFIIYKSDVSGIADRIIHLISTYLIALLTNRLLIFDSKWPELVAIFQPSLNFEQHDPYAFFYQLDLSIVNLTSKSTWFSFDRFLKDYNYDRDFPEQILICYGHTGGVIHTINSNTSFYRKYLTVDLKMNEKNLFGCLYHSLFIYRLSELIKRISSKSLTDPFEQGHSPEFILQTLLSPNIHSIGLQIRAGDKTFRHNRLQNFDKIQRLKKYHNYFKCAQNILKKHQNKSKHMNQIGVIYLLSDDIQIRLAALSHWKFSRYNVSKSGFYILSSSQPVYHVAYSRYPMLSFQLGIFDAFLFSLCQQHIISTQSGFGRFAVFSSLQQRNIYSLDIHEKSSCEDEGLQLEVSGRHWSGI